MLVEEAQWFNKRITEIPGESVFPMLNVGSSSEYQRTVLQPYADSYLFKPAREKGMQIVHTDLQDAPGVDIVGDLLDTAFLEQLKKMTFKSILCSNLLEHVTNREEICQVLVNIVEPRGFLFVSVPYRFPYHESPIDTMFRPNPEQLHALFPGTSIITSGIVEGDSSYFKDLITGTGRLLPLLRGFMPFYKPKSWLRLYHSKVIQNQINYLPYTFEKYKVTCVVLHKQ